jgi:hypothetical protein
VNNTAAPVGELLSAVAISGEACTDEWLGAASIKSDFADRGFDDCEPAVESECSTMPTDAGLFGVAKPGVLAETSSASSDEITTRRDDGPAFKFGSAGIVENCRGLSPFVSPAVDSTVAEEMGTAPFSTSGFSATGAERSVSDDCRIAASRS